MKNPKKYEFGITLIEILLLLSILLIVASWFFRIFYAHEIREWEDGIYRFIGVDPDFARFAVGTIALVVLVIIALKRRRVRRRKSLLD